MDAGVKKLWTDALRSGEYEQAQGVLRNDEGYCCLGVLCDIAVKNGVIEEPSYEDSYEKYDYGDLDYNYPPSEVLEWAGLRDGDEFLASDPSVPADGLDEDRTTVSLSELNDSYDKDFDYIADVIDAHL